ncbi:MAG: hypothetical protein MI725_04870, partial [Pirellulales bacterium]|nr:hypothetical protein [Pirellulales bacterium]
MGRFLAIVIALVAIALVINSSMNQGEAPEASKEKPAAEKKAAAEETVLLGSGDLLAGIPGEGALTVEQVNAWLADARNHVVLKPQLPLGLAAGAAEIKGIDE